MPDRLLLPLFVCLWTSGYVVGAVAIQAAGPLPLLAARFTLATLIAAPLALRRARPDRRRLGQLAVLGVLLQILQFGGVYGGFALGVPAALSALVMLGLSPLVTTGLAVAAGQERADARLWAGLAVGVAGVALSLAPELGSARAGAGVGLTLLGMLGLSAGTVLQKRWRTEPVVAAAVQNGVAAVVLLPLALLVGGRFAIGTQLVLSVGWIAAGLGLFTLSVFVTLVRRHAASAVAALLLVVPAVTAIASAPALGEQLHPASLAGMVVAILGTGAVLRREGGQAKTPAALAYSRSGSVGGVP
jgi:drug/metabolite transporter (DMT)-like permease